MALSLSRVTTIFFILSPRSANLSKYKLFRITLKTHQNGEINFNSELVMLLLSWIEGMFSFHLIKFLC